MESKIVLKSLKVSAFGADCKYRIVETDENDGMSENEFHVKISRSVQFELAEIFMKRLPEVVADMIGDIAAYDTETMMATKIRATGITFAGKDDNEGVSIIGERESKCGKITFKTPRIKYLLGDTDFHAKLTVIAADIRREFETYLRGEISKPEVFD